MVLEQFRADIIARDSAEQPVAVVEVKAYNDAGIAALAQLQQYMSQSRTDIPFVILVDLTTIQIFRWEERRLDGPVATLPTAEVLRHYDPNYPPQRIFHEYLTQLIASWLRDLAYQWKSEDPPGFEVLTTIGLAALLGNGDTVKESLLTA